MLQLMQVSDTEFTTNDGTVVTVTDESMGWMYTITHADGTVEYACSMDEVFTVLDVW